MLVRVHDSQTGACFFSEVYAVVNIGFYERRLVRVPDETGGVMRFFDCLTKGNPLPNMQINMIAAGEHSDWIRVNACIDNQIAEYTEVLKKETKFNAFYGFHWLFAERDVLRRLLEGASVPVKGSIFETKLYSVMQPGWNYVWAQEDAKLLLEETGWFHDSILHSLHYESGGFVDGKRAMHFPFNLGSQVTIRLDSQICGSLEMVFEGVKAVRLRPAGDNETGDIFEATICVNDCAVLFCDEEDATFDSPGEGTWVIAYSLRWRYI